MLCFPYCLCIPLVYVRKSAVSEVTYRALSAGVKTHDGRERNTVEIPASGGPVFSCAQYLTCL